MKTPPSPFSRRFAATLSLAAAFGVALIAQTTKSNTAQPAQPPGSPPPPIPAATPPGPTSSPTPASQKTVDPLQEIRTPATAPDAEQQDFSRVDAELETIKRHIENAPSEDERDAAKVRYASLKDRRDELKASFNRARFELFKSDVSTEAGRVKNWTSTGAADADGNNPAVARLDIDLKLLRSRADMLDQNRKGDLVRRIEDFERRRNAINQRFDQSQFESLRREIQAEWDRLGR